MLEQKVNIVGARHSASDISIGNGVEKARRSHMQGDVFGVAGLGCG